MGCCLFGCLGLALFDILLTVACCLLHFRVFVCRFGCSACCYEHGICIVCVALRLCWFTICLLSVFLYCLKLGLGFVFEF